MSETIHEAELRRANRALRMLSDSNQSVIRATDEPMLLNEVCRIAVVVGGYRMAWVGLAENDEQKSVRMVAHRGGPLPYGGTSGMTWSELAVKAAPAGWAVRTGAERLVRDVTTDLEYAPWREAALGFGYRSLMALPMRVEGRTLGALSVYAAEPDAFDERELEILRELAGDVAYGLDALRVRAERDRATVSLQQVLLHARTLVMQADVTGLPGWEQHGAEQGAMHFLWRAHFEDEVAAQEVMPLALGPGEDYYAGWVRAKLQDDWHPMGMVAARAFLSGAASWRQEFRAVDRDGRLHWFAQVASIQTLSPGRWHVTTINTDITERRKAEDALHTREEQFVALSENSPDIIARLNREGRYIYVNGTTARITGLPVSSFLGRQIAEPFSDVQSAEVPEGLVALPEAVEQVFELGEPKERVVSLPLSMGERIFDIRLVPERDARGVVISVLCVARDVTEQKRAEEALRESQARLELANRATRIGPWDWNLVTNEVHLSAEWKRQLGYEEDEIPARFEEWENRLHPDDHDRVLAELRACLAGERPEYEVEFRLRHKDGSYRWIFTRAEVFRRPDGTLLRMSGCHLDITARKQAEEALREHMARVLRQEAALVALTKQAPLRDDDLRTSLRRLTEAAARALGVARVSVWRFQPDRSGIECEDLYELSGDKHSAGVKIAAVDNPPYFHALTTADVIAADDARTDPATARFTTDYLIPLGITSMLDVPIRVKGETVGVLCHEHVGPPRHWASDERTFAIAMANLATLALEEADRKRAQAELRSSQEAYALLVNTVDGIVWEVDVRTFQFTFVSQQAERILGYPIERWLGDPKFWIEHMYPDDRTWTVDYCLSATREKKDHDFQYRMIAADGRVVWLHDIVTVVIENGEASKLRGIMVDITETKRADEALRWRTALFEAQVDTGLDGILVVDAHGKKILQNQRMAELWKIPQAIADDPDDRQQIQFVSGRAKHPREFAEKVAYLYAHPEEICRDEVELVDGMVLDRYSAPVRDKSGKYYGRIWTFRDVTATKQLEEQLRQAQKMEAVGQLAGGIAHDFNNLLTVIQMQASMLLSDPRADSEVVQSIQQIMAAAQRAGILTRQLLTFSRRHTKEARNLDLGEVIGTMTKLVRRILGEDISMETRFAPGLPWVHADPGMIEQVLMNLLVNARDAMPEGGELGLGLNAVTIDDRYVASHPSARPGRFVCLEVSDTGRGIAPEHLPRIFEPFFTTKEVGKGTGLGLAIVFGIVQQHNGWIEVASDLGRGTTFRVYLPAVERQEERLMRGAGPALRGGTETILVVEDEPVVRALAVASLQRYGYRVLEAGTGAEALQLWEAHPGEVDLLLTDMIMPGGVSGQKLADELRRRRPALRIIYTSGYNNESAMRQLSLVIGRNFLPKPYPVNDLIAIVRRQLDER